MRSTTRLLAIFGLALGLIGATTLTASAVVTDFEVVVLDCATDDPNIQPGQVDFLVGQFAADDVECITTTFGEDGTALTLYAEDGTTVLDTGEIAGGEGSGSLSYDFTGTQNLRFGVGTAPAEDISGTFFDVAAGEAFFVVAVRYQAAPAAAGDIEVLKFDCVNDGLAGDVVFDIPGAIDTSECGPGNGYLIGLLDGEDAPVRDPAPTVDGFLAFAGLAPGTYRLTENGQISGDIELLENESVIVQVVNYVAAEQPDGVLNLANVTCVGDTPGTTFLITPPGEVQQADTLECVLGPESFLIYAFEDLQSQAIPFAIDASGQGSITLPAGTHTIVEPDSGAQATFTIAGNATTLGLVQTVVEPAPTTGSVLISAFTCIGAQAGVEIEVSEPTFAADDVDLTDCDPLNQLSFSIFPFGDTNAAPITGTTDSDGNGDGTVLLDGIPTTEGEPPAHLFRTVVFDTTFPANFEVAAGGITAITVIVFEPAPPTPAATATTAPTAAATATTPATVPATATGTTPAAVATATGTVTTLPSTGTGGGFGGAGGAAWLLAGVLALVACGSAGYVIRRRAA